MLFGNLEQTTARVFKLLYIFMYSLHIAFYSVRKKNIKNIFKQI